MEFHADGERSTGFEQVQMPNVSEFVWNPFYQISCQFPFLLAYSVGHCSDKLGISCQPR